MKLFRCICLTALPLIAQIPEFSYVHPELSLFSFDQSEVISYKEVQIRKTLDPDGGDVVSEKWTEEFTFQGDSTKLIIGGRGNDRICRFDNEGNVESIVEGNGAVYFSYSDDVDAIVSLPTDTGLTRHSRIYTAVRNGSGDTTMLTVTATDWDQDVANSEFWDDDHTDTAHIYRDSEGRIAGVQRNFWKSNHFHTIPWQKESDSLGYSYTNSPDSSMTITRYSLHPVSGEWIMKHHNWGVVTYFNESGLVTGKEELRWDASRSEWDPVYRKETKISYKSIYPKNVEQWLYWGTEEQPESLCTRSEQIFYQKNPLIFGETSLAGSSAAHKKASLTVLGEKIQLTTPVAGVWNVAIADTRGRVVKQFSRSCDGNEQVQFDMSSLASGIFLVTVKNNQSGVLVSQKIVR